MGPSIVRDFYLEMLSLDPHPVFEVKTDNISKFIAWVLNPALGENLSLIFKGNQYRFYSYEERRLFGLGFEKAYELHLHLTDALKDQIDGLLFPELPEPDVEPFVTHSSEVRMKAVPQPTSHPIAAIKLRKIQAVK